MKDYTKLKIQEELDVLLKGALTSIPFNIALGLLLSFYLTYQGTPIIIVSAWYIVLFMLSVFRLLMTILSLKYHWYKTTPQHVLQAFLFMVFVTSIVWMCSYFIFLSYIHDRFSEAILILFLGGMCLGSLISLSIIPLAFYLFILPIFLPIIIYNYLYFQVDRAVMATMFLSFVIGLSLFARINNTMWLKIFYLNREKDTLLDGKPPLK